MDIEKSTRDRRHKKYTCDLSVRRCGATYCCQERNRNTRRRIRCVDFRRPISVGIISLTDLELEDLELGEVVPLLLQELFLVPVLVPLYQVLHREGEAKPTQGEGKSINITLLVSTCNDLPPPPSVTSPSTPPAPPPRYTHPNA